MVIEKDRLRQHRKQAPHRAPNPEKLNPLAFIAPLIDKTYARLSTDCNPARYWRLTGFSVKGQKAWLINH
jgi:hypothetical protein